MENGRVMLVPKEKSVMAFACNDASTEYMIEKSKAIRENARIEGVK